MLYVCGEIISYYDSILNLVPFVSRHMDLIRLVVQNRSCPSGNLLELIGCTKDAYANE